jgi:glycerol-3-phosphate dehydrogenase subunit C
MSAHGPDTRGYDHQNPLFWDAKGLDAELRRVFTICNGCRLCYNLCPSFPELYNRVDAIDQQREEARAQARAARGEAPAPPVAAPVEHSPNSEHHVVAYGSVEVSSENLVDALTKDDLRRVVDLCYNCKLCYPICPYKPPHEFEVDFPRLMVRSKIVTAKHEGVTTQDKFLGAVDTVGSMMTKVSGLANAANHSKFQRMLMEKTVGIHRDRLLPSWASETFVSWWRKREAKRAQESSRRSAPAPAEATPASLTEAPQEPLKVVLFYTCFANYNDPDLGQAAVEVLERQGAEVVCPEFKCCGMPFLDGGDLKNTLANIEHNLKLLVPLVKQGYKVVSPGPTCTFMLKQEYPELSKREDAHEVAKNVEDLGEFLLKLHRQGRLDTNFAERIGKVAYHIPCHNKVQGIGFKGRDLLKAAGAQVKMVDKCCGMDGTWGMKKEFFTLSLKVAEKAFRGVEQAEPDIVVTDCPLAGLQLTQGTKRRAYHPVKVLRAAYQGKRLQDEPGNNENR